MQSIQEIELVISTTKAALESVKAAAALDRKTFHLTHIRINYQASIDDLECEIGAMGALLIRVKTIGR